MKRVILMMFAAFLAVSLMAQVPSGLTTTTAFEQMCDYASSGSAAFSQGGSPVTEKGGLWRSSPGLTKANSNVRWMGSGTTAFLFGMPVGGVIAPGAMVYYRSYAVNSSGIGYGPEKSFENWHNNITLITSSTSCQILRTLICVSSTIERGCLDLPTDKGHCWSTSQNPTINNSHQHNGATLGAWSANISALAPNTTYYIRAWGVSPQYQTVYGNQVSFTTLP